MDTKNLIELFKEAKQKDKSENTVSAYVTDLKQFSKYYSKDLSELTTDEVETWKGLLLNKKYKAKTINRKLTSVRRFCDYFNNLPDNNKKVLAEIKTFKIQKQEYLEDVLSSSDFERLVRAAEINNDKTAYTLINSLYYTGARISELLQIKVCDAGNDFITIRGKGSKLRDLFIADDLKRIWRDYIKDREGEDFSPMFLNTRRHPMDRQTAHNIIKKYAGIAKVKLSRAHCHAFRHRRAIDMLEAGYSQSEVADFLGHSDINTTRIYTRKTKSELLKRLNRR